MLLFLRVCYGVWVENIPCLCRTIRTSIDSTVLPMVVGGDCAGKVLALRLDGPEFKFLV